MSYSRRQLYAMGEPLGDSATYRKADGGLILGGGGSSAPAPAPTSTQTTVSELPDWARGYAQDTLAKGSALTDINKNPYQTYGGQRVAGFSDLQNQSFQGAQDLGPNAMTVGGGMNALNAGNNYNQMATNPGATQAFMSPYMQNVVNTQMQEANRNYDISGVNQQSQATQAGAFGGGRDAIMRAENERNRNTALNGIQATGLQNAFQNAQQAQQFGSTLGLQGAQAAIGAGQNAFTQEQGALNTQNAMGAQQQAQTQKGLDTAYQDFLNQQNYPYKQLSYMSDLIHGTPIGMQATNQVYQAPPTAVQTVGSLGLGAAGISSLLKADGGVVHSYADGGEVSPMNDQNAMAADVSKLSDQQLQQILQSPTTKAEYDAAQAEVSFRASLHRGIAGGITPDMVQKMAGGGGVLAFAGNNGSYVPEGTEDTDGTEGRQDVYSAGDPNAFRGFNQELVRSMDAIRNFKPAGMTNKEYSDAIMQRNNLLTKMAGPSPYEGYAAKLDAQDKERSSSLDQGRGIALLQAAGALSQGNNLIRGLGAAGSAFGSSYGDALKADAAEKRSIASMQFNIADAQRKERMGQSREAIAAADQARKDKSDANRAEIEKHKALGTLAAAGARATKPTGTAGAGNKLPQVDRLAGQIATQIVDLKQKNPSDPQIKVLESKLAGLKDVIATTKTSDKGPDVLAAEAAKLAAMTDKDIDAQVRKDKFMNADWQNAMGDAKAQAAVESRIRNEILTRRNQATSTVNNNSGKLKFDEQGNQIN